MQMIRGAGSDVMLADPAFHDEWAALCTACPWSTPFQSPLLAGVWYRTYRALFEPVLVLCRDDDGQLVGLLPLALDLHGQGLTVAGAYQAEYQVWICRPELAEIFPLLAFQQIHSEIHRKLFLRYLPPATPLGWATLGSASRSCLLKKHSRPIMKFGDGSEINASLNKSGNKSRLRRLKKMGAIEFRHVQDPAEFQPLLDEIIPCHDVRYMAFHGFAPFQADHLKREFHQAMMNTPSLLHITTLRVGGLLASAHLNVVRNKEVQLSLISHNPLLSKLSPGKLHMLFLAKMLREEGFEQLDLTPGGEAYKDRHATDSDEVHILTVYPSSITAKVRQAYEIPKRAAHRLLKAVRIDPAWAKPVAHRVARLGPGGLTAHLCGRWRSWIHCHQQRCLYAISAAAGADMARSPLLRRDALQDLLVYRPTSLTGHKPSLHEFLLDAVKRMEEGQHFYSHVEHGRLAYLAWVIERPEEKLVDPALAGLVLPPNSALILPAFSCDCESRCEMDAITLRTILHDLSKIDGIEKVYLAVNPRNTRCRRVAESLGFEAWVSHFTHTAFGRNRHRTVPQPMPGKPRLVAGNTQPTSESDKIKAQLASNY